MGRARDWNVDLIPKFIMANGKKSIVVFKRTDWFTLVYVGVFLTQL